MICDNIACENFSFVYAQSVFWSPAVQSTFVDAMKTAILKLLLAMALSVCNGD